MAERRAVEEMASAILDGTPVDWASAESTSPGPERELIPHLRVVERIAEAHRGEGRAERPAPPATWGHLRILEQVGAGGFGAVYRAWDPRLEREVALKLLDGGAGDSDSPVVAEGRLLARVRHPNVVTVYGAERAAGHVGLWMEFVRGRRLDETLRAHGAFGAHEAAVIGLTVCRALSAVHQAGLLHRDVKAQNVIREDGGRLVLMDFGAGSMLSETGPDAARRLAGTPLYLAPELFAGAPPTARSDIYAAGVLLFHLVTLAFPVAGSSLADLRRAHQEGRRRYLRDLRPDLPEAFVAVVEQALAPDPAARYATAGAMEAALARVVAHGGPRRVPPRAWIAGAAAVLVAAAGLALLATRGRERSHAGSLPPAAFAPGGVGVAPTVTVRKIEMPPAQFHGRPSADGRLLSFADADGNLALLEIATGAVRRLTSAEADSDQRAQFSAISTDGRLVAYTWWALDGRCELRVIGADGRRPRVLLRRDDVDVARPLEWSRDGSAVLAVLSRADGGAALALVSSDDGSVRPLRELEADVRNASLSPDGTSLVFDAPAAPGAAQRDVFIAGVSGEEPRPLVRHPADDHSPLWTADGERILFASDRSGAVDLWSAAAAAPRDPELVHRGLGRMWVLGLTDAGTYVYQSVTGPVEVHTAEWDGATAGDPTALPTRYLGSNISSVWSPDGRAVAYVSRRGLTPFDRRSTTLVVRDLESGAERELALPLLSFLVRSWSADGATIAISGTDDAGRAGVYAVGATTGAVRPLMVADRPSQAIGGRVEWAPDGRLLYLDRGRRGVVARDAASGREEILLDLRAAGVDALGGNILGRGYRLSPDGRRLGFSGAVRDSGGASDVLRVREGDGSIRELARVAAPERLVFQDWTPDSRTILFTRRAGDGEPPALWSVPADGGEARPAGLSAKALRDISVSPDGRRLTFTAGMPVLEVWALENALPSLGSGR